MGLHRSPVPFDRLRNINSNGPSGPRSSGSASPHAGCRRHWASWRTRTSCTESTSWRPTIRCCRGRTTRRGPPPPGSRPDIPRTSRYCPAVTSVAMARRYGVSFVLEFHGAPGPKGAIYVEKIGNEDLYRIPHAAEAMLVPAPKSGHLPPDDAVGSPVAVASSEPGHWKVVVDPATTLSAPASSHRCPRLARVDRRAAAGPLDRSPA